MRHACARPLLALFLFGSAGSLIELLLLEHVDSATQWGPVVLLAVGSACATILIFRPEAALRRLWGGLMASYGIAGPVGVFLHLRGNREFEREIDAASAGLRLWKETLMGATPALAPAAMTLLGALGWLALREGPVERRP